MLEQVLTLLCSGGLLSIGMYDAFAGKRQKKYARRALGLYICILASTVLLMQFITYYANWQNVLYTLLSLLFYVSLMTIAPLSYFYLRSFYKTTEKEDGTSVFHFIPSIGLLLINVFGFFIIAFARQSSIFFTVTYDIIFFLNFTVITFFFGVQNVFYVFYMLKIVKAGRNAGHSFRAQYIVGAYLVFIASIYVQQIIEQGFTGWWLSVILLLYVGVLKMGDYMIPAREKSGDIVSAQTAAIEKEISPLINDELANRINTRLLEVMEEQEIYKQANLSLSGLAKALETNSKYLRYVITQKHNTTFVSFVNEYRIRKAQTMLQEVDNKVYTIESIGQMAGFKSKSSFYSAFKDYTGLTPHQYRQEYFLRN